jgi:hypothetical protein
MTSIPPISLSMLGTDSWLATRGSVPVGRVELRDDRFVVTAADQYELGRFREFGKALTALDGYRGLHRSWKALLVVALVIGAAAVGVAVFGIDLLF